MNASEHEGGTTRANTTSTGETWVGKWTRRIAFFPFVVLFCLIFIPYNLCTDTWYRDIRNYRWYQRYVERQRKKKEDEGRIPPKIIQRKRAISSFDKFRGQKVLEKQNLQPSTLHVLPKELQLQIFDFLLYPGEPIHIIFWQGTLHSYRCRRTQDRNVLGQHKGCWDPYCNESLTNKSLPHSYTPGLGFLPFLQTSRIIYNEYINQLYSRPTFLFHDFISFIAFCSSLVPQRFHSIQHIELYQTALYGSNSSSVPGHIWQPLFTGKPGYDTLHEYKFQARNAILKQLPPENNVQLDNNRWVHVRKILRQMSALREVKVSLYFLEREEDEVQEELERHEPWYEDDETMMRRWINEVWTSTDVQEWRELKDLKQWRAPREWNDFEFRTDVYLVDGVWHGVKYLRKKK